MPTGGVLPQRSPAICPFCGAEVYYKATAISRVTKIIAGPPVEPEPSIEPPLGAVTWHDITCSRCSSLLRYPTQAISPVYFRDVVCPICGSSLGVKSIRGEVQIVERKPWPPITPTPDILPFPPVTPLPPPEEKLPVVPPEVAERVDEKLDRWEEQVESLEDSFRGMKSSESEAIAQQYGILAETAAKLLATLQDEKTRRSPMMGVLPYAGYYPTWTLAQKMRLENLLTRLIRLIQNCRTEAQRGPTPWPQLPTDFLIDYPEIKPLPGIAPYPPSWASELTTEVVQRRVQEGVPEYRDIEGYSVQERILEAIGEEPRELALEAPALAAPPPKKISPYLILAGLTVTTLAVWSYKKKKRKIEAKK